jgi:hypothetical protein
LVAPALLVAIASSTVVFSGVAVVGPTLVTP